ncbi:MAG TPA: flagellar brake protein [Sulfuricella sp.]|nr:flagellar brake protein [Sulfuricella sp.]
MTISDKPQEKINVESHSTGPNEAGQIGILKTDDDYSQYEVSQPNEIVHILRSIMEGGDLVSASFNHGKYFMLTAIVGVDPHQDAAFLDFGSIEEQNRKILDSEKIIFNTSHDKVKIQFTANKIEKTIFEGRDAFKIKLPDSLIRLQRREYYRLLLPIFSPLKCAMPMEDGYTIESVVVDISIGGINITLPPTETGFEQGKIFRGCQMELPDIGTINADIEIVNVFEVTLKNGKKSTRAGCGFINLSQKMQAMIQRFIIQAERKLRSMQLDRE